MPHKIKRKPLKSWIIRTDAIVSARDQIRVDIIADEIFKAVEEVDKRHPTTSDFTFKNIITKNKKLDY